MKRLPADVSRAAFELIASGHGDAAAALWSTAPADLVEPESRILAINNAAVAKVLRSEKAAAVNLLHGNPALRDALQQSDRQRDAGVPGTSSAFHIRLAAKHAASFATAFDSRTQKLVAAIRAVVAHHTRIAGASAADAPKGSTLKRALTGACGADSLEVATLDAQTPAQWRDIYRARADRLNRLLALDVTTGRFRLELALAAMAILPDAVSARPWLDIPLHANKDAHAG